MYVIQPIKTYLPSSKKVIRLMCFQNKRTLSENLFESADILDVYKLYLHEVLKFAVKSVPQKHPSNYLNGLFERKTVSSLMTRSVNRREFDLLSPKIQTIKIL